jgi:hypothetical protein
MGGGWSTTRPASLPPANRPGTHYAGGWVTLYFFDIPIIYEIEDKFRTKREINSFEIL